MEDVERKLWNIGLIIEEIENFPQTYETILKEHRHNGTYQTVLRRKLNILCRDGHICKTSIPGTRFGKAVYYVIPKKYYFLVEGSRTRGSESYAFYEFEKRGKSYMVVKDCWRLVKTEWVKCEDKMVFFDGDVLKFI